MPNTKSPILFLSDDVKDYAPWYYMKCSNALESLSHIADLINHPDCDNLSSSMWKELLLFNLHNAVWNLMAMYSRTQGLSLPPITSRTKDTMAMYEYPVKAQSKVRKNILMTENPSNALISF